MFKKLTLLAAATLISLLPLRAASAATVPNLISNPSVETSADGINPDGWIYGNWGTNTSTATYQNTGHTGNRSLKVEATAWTNGAANWYYTPVTVSAGQSYEYSNWYQSNVDSEVDAEVTMADGTISYLLLGNVSANAAWTQYKTTFTAPANATKVAIFQILTKVGYVTTDDYSLSAYTAAPFNRPIVSVTFDDGWANQYINGRQVMKDNGINATFYLISKELANGKATSDEYMNKTQAQGLFADGHEMASHTIDHCSMNGTTKDPACTDPTAVSPAAATQFITNEMTTSKNDIQTLVPGSAVTNFAYPYGEYSAESINIGKGIYTSQRTVECGYNSKDNLDLSKLKGCEVNASTSVNDIKALIDNAIAQKTWLILFFHEIANAGQGAPGDEPYTTSVADFTAIIQYINSRKADLDNMTVAKAITTLNGSTTPPVTPPVTPPAANKTSVYRMANWMTKERLFTTDINEVNAIKDKDGWVYEGVAFYATNQGQPVYRMANWMTHERMFTADLNEVNAIQDKDGWVYEGVAFYEGTQGQPVYRMANFVTHERLFTADGNERDAIQGKNGWVYEGIAFYAQQ